MSRRGAATLALALLLVPAACGDDDRAGARAPADSTPERGPVAVRTEERTVAGLRTYVVRPRGRGPWPVVVFVHGAGAPPEFYEDLLRDLAAAGHVVVAPAMPGSVDRSDEQALLALPSQPARVQRVLDALDRPRPAVPGVDPDAVVLAGHSLGAMTVLGAAFHECCAGGEVDGVIAIAGRLTAFEGGGYRRGRIPLLLVHGDDDTTVPYAGSARALDRVGRPALLLTVEGGDHGRYLGPASPRYPTIRDATLAFLEASLGGDPEAGRADLVAAAGTEGFRLTARD